LKQPLEDQKECVPVLFNECGFDWGWTTLIDKREDEEQVERADVFEQNEK
jgi:hypothetical protein